MIKTSLSQRNRKLIILVIVLAKRNGRKREEMRIDSVSPGILMGISKILRLKVVRFSAIKERMIQ